MFGAYQAGAWKALADRFQPDIVVGASAGALNAWAIAGGCPADDLCAFWTNPASADLMRLRATARPWRGVFDSEPVYRQIDQFYSRFRPRVPLAIAMVEVPRPRQVLVKNDRITAMHLRATCAIPFGYPAVRIAGKLHVDGGLLTAVPLWAAAEMGATSAVVINALEFMPSIFLRVVVGAFRAVAAPKAGFPGMEITMIRPSVPLGSVRSACFWKEENVRRWIALGERDAAAVGDQLALKRIHR